MTSTRQPSRRPGLERRGESSLKSLDWLTFLRAVPGQVEALSTRVPPSHVRFEGSDAVVDCTCDGGLPILVAPMRSKRCKCGRVFVNIGCEEVRVCRTEGLG